MLKDDSAARQPVDDSDSDGGDDLLHGPRKKEEGHDEASALKWGDEGLMPVANLPSGSN